MKNVLLVFLGVIGSFCAYSQATAPPDSILKKIEKLENVTAIKYIEKKYPNEAIKSSGWAYLFQEGNRTKYVRMGHWQYFRKDGTLEFEDFAPVDDQLPIREIHYDKDGKKIMEVLQAQEFDKGNNLKKATYTETKFHENGKIASRIHYKNKKKVNTWKWFDPEGNITNQKEYTKAY